MDSHLEIPCHFMSQIDGGLVQIHTKFHDYSMSFIQILFVFHAGTWHGFWKSSSHGISMAFAKKMVGFPSDLVSFSTKLPSKRHEKIPITFYRVLWNSRHEFFHVVLTAFWSKMRPNSIIFLANAMEIPWLDRVRNTCRVPTWETNKTWINDME